MSRSREPHHVENANMISSVEIKIPVALVGAVYLFLFPRAAWGPFPHFLDVIIAAIDSSPPPVPSAHPREDANEGGG